MTGFTEKTFGGLDWAVNNAGIGGESSAIGDYSLEGWHKVISVNLNSVFYCMKYEIGAMLRRGGGAIVNISSILGTNGFASAGAYVSAKHGVVGLTRSAALDLATESIRVNAICPGVIQTPMIDRFTGEDDAARAALTAGAPMARVGVPEEIASAVLWLCSRGASYTTGQAIAVDGGWTAR